MKRIGKWLGITFLGLTVLVGTSGRRISELMGYARATADKTVEQLEDSVPAAVRDQKLQNDIETARGEIIDRRVKLNLAASEVRRLQDEVGQLTVAVERRELILAEAYPALETASADRLTEVSFAGTNWQPLELGGEVDRLLMEQDRDERQLTIRREALDRAILPRLLELLAHWAGIANHRAEKHPQSQTYRSSISILCFRHNSRNSS